MTEHDAQPEATAAPEDRSVLRRVDLDRACWYTYAPAWIPSAEADALFETLMEESEWQQRAIVARGKEVMQPRLLDWAGTERYRYSGQELETRPFSAALEALTARVAEATDAPYNHVLLNLYRDGRDSIGMHADNEPELGWEPTIASISLGAQRRFIIQHKKKRSWRRTITLEHGSLLVMGGAFQRRWRHAVPRQAAEIGPRINVTLRELLGPPGWRPEPMRFRE